MALLHESPDLATRLVAGKFESGVTMMRKAVAELSTGSEADLEVGGMCVASPEAEVSGGVEWPKVTEEAVIAR